MLAALGSRIDVHFDREARAAFRELRGQLDLGRFARGLFLQNFFHRGLRQRREMKLQTARDDGGQKSIGRRRREDERGRLGRLFENLQENVGDVPAHGIRSIEDEDAAPAHGLKVRGALHGAQLAHTQHRPDNRTF